jgi:hypothetical protein
MMQSLAIVYDRLSLILFLVVLELFREIWHAKMNRFKVTYTKYSQTNNQYQCHSESISLIVISG